jgi:hypothetical protein
VKWLNLVRVILELLGTVSRLLQERRLIAEIEAREAARALQEALDVIDMANRARRDARSRDADGKRLRDDDGFRRD